ncbi:hypothetical protein PRZ48_013912 [Zasmidium cellare]|uniref:RING-type domain-containing protein n=1 Tax=Zasmidium cellare TaxID=395010 RepID=A0ABR0DZY0_ZASCE|nr:hypothetical protein PRZ48_013912 [Zasmidium cellare]
MKDCPICESEQTPLSKPLDSHACYTTVPGKKKPEVNRCCAACWEHWFSSQIESGPWDEIRCIFCPYKFDEGEMSKLGAHLDTMTRYHKKKAAVKEFKCQARCQGTDTPAQPFDREKDGRIFTCKNCSFQTCVDCDRPEHPEKTCEEVQASIREDPAEIATATAEKLLSCPKCHVTGKSDGCGYTVCVGQGMSGGCGHRFCGHCLIDWVGGEGSAYACGQTAHATDCKYYNQELDSSHNFSHRFPRSKEAQKLFDAKKEHKRELAKARKAKAAEGNAGRVVKDTSSRKTAKTGKKAKALTTG